MTTIKIRCDNCGANYKLPETFKSPKAKCQKCGSVIDVAGQREAAGDQGDAAPAKPAAAARPAVDRSKSKPAEARPAARASGRRAGGRRAKADDADEAPRGRRGREPKKKDNMPMIVGGSSLVAIVILVIVFLNWNSDDNVTEKDTAQNEPKTSQADGNDGKPAASGDGAATDGQDNSTASDPAPADGSTADGDAADGEAADAEAAPDGDAAADAAAAPTEASAPAKLPPNAPRWMKIKNVQTMDQVNDEFPEVPWDKLTAEKKQEVQDLAADYAGGGRPGLNAEKTMRERPYEAMFGLLDYLRSLDHKDPMDMMQAYALNRFMTELTNGLQTGFVAVELDEEIDPRKAQWNCITTRAWLQFFDIHPDEKTFKEKNEERRKKELRAGR